jgi:tetratricopeptide (TPR) repeat protein
MDQQTALWNSIDRAFERWLAPSDAALERVIASAAKAGLPEIAVAPAQGRLLEVLARAIGARRILEIGTLAGYSALWLARALPADGTLVTLELEPDHVMSLNNLAYSAIDRGEIDAETIRRAERAHALRPDDPSVLDTLGWLRYKQARFRDDASGPGAVTLLVRSIQQRPEDPGLEPLDHLGDALWRAGDRAAAIRAWQAAAELLERAHPRSSIVEGLPIYERREQGLQLQDPEDFWRRSYADIAERAARKARTALAGGEPATAPIATGPLPLP